MWQAQSFSKQLLSSRLSLCWCIRSSNLILFTIGDHTLRAVELAVAWLYWIAASDAYRFPGVVTKSEDSSVDSLFRSSFIQNMLRSDLQASLFSSGINLDKLSPFQRILLTTDGTLTDILEAYVWEPIEIVKLMQETVKVPEAIPLLDIGTQTEVLHREVLLRGARSEKHYLHATSVLVLDRLDQGLREELMTTQEPLGKLMIQSRLETFKEIVKCSSRKAPDVGKVFGELPDTALISRTYRVFSQGRPFILITESFPGSYFRD